MELISKREILSAYLGWTETSEFVYPSVVLFPILQATGRDGSLLVQMFLAESANNRTNGICVRSLARIDLASKDGVTVVLGGCLFTDFVLREPIKSRQYAHPSRQNLVVDLDRLHRIGGSSAEKLGEGED